MNRITFTVDENGHFVRICADEEVDAFIVDPNVPRDRVYQWSSLRVRRDAVEQEIGGWPISDRYSQPFSHEKAKVG
ncbi:hypothetical protein [Roseomonas sp. BN140053]|uniref:hypothetical protein n=1 Tax=Roseomonas sp. BN140053 TaxID=3391898 RepID=UPI0039ED51C1